MEAHLSDREREFLERSLADLDRELAAGDLSRDDHARLSAVYRRRLAGEPPPSRPPARPGLVAAAVAFVAVVAVAAGVLVAQWSGRREDGSPITGGSPVATAPAPSTSLPEDLARCRSLSGGPAIDCYTAYTEANPDDPQGWFGFALFAINNGIETGRRELLDAGETFLRRALDLDPDHVEARVYLAVVLERTGQAAPAAEECARLAGLDVPAELTTLVDLACGEP